MFNPNYNFGGVPPVNQGPPNAFQQAAAAPGAFPAGGVPFVPNNPLSGEDVSHFPPELEGQLKSLLLDRGVPSRYAWWLTSDAGGNVRSVLEFVTIGLPDGQSIRNIPHQARVAAMAVNPNQTEIPPPTIAAANKLHTAWCIAQGLVSGNKVALMGGPMRPKMMGAPVQPLENAEVATHIAPYELHIGQTIAENQLLDHASFAIALKDNQQQTYTPINLSKAKLLNRADAPELKIWKFDDKDQSWQLAAGGPTGKAQDHHHFRQWIEVAEKNFNVFTKFPRNFGFQLFYVFFRKLFFSFHLLYQTCVICKVWYADMKTRSILAWRQPFQKSRTNPAEAWLSFDVVLDHKNSYMMWMKRQNDNSKLDLKQLMDFDMEMKKKWAEDIKERGMSLNAAIMHSMTAYLWIWNHVGNRHLKDLQRQPPGRGGVDGNRNQRTPAGDDQPNNDGLSKNQKKNQKQKKLLQESRARVKAGKGSKEDKARVKKADDKSTKRKDKRDTGKAPAGADPKKGGGESALQKMKKHAYNIKEIEKLFPGKTLSVAKADSDGKEHCRFVGKKEGCSKSAAECTHSHLCDLAMPSETGGTAKACGQDHKRHQCHMWKTEKIRKKLLVPKLNKNFDPLKSPHTIAEPCTTESCASYSDFEDATDSSEGLDTASSSEEDIPAEIAYEIGAGPGQVVPSSCSLEVPATALDTVTPAECSNERHGKRTAAELVIAEVTPAETVGAISEPSAVEGVPDLNDTDLPPTANVARPLGPSPIQEKYGQLYVDDPAAKARPTFELLREREEAWLNLTWTQRVMQRAAHDELSDEHEPKASKFETITQEKLSRAGLGSPITLADCKGDRWFWAIRFFNELVRLKRTQMVQDIVFMKIIIDKESPHLCLSHVLTEVEYKSYSKFFFQFNLFCLKFSKLFRFVTSKILKNLFRNR